MRSPTGVAHFVSVPSPASDYLRALPLLVKREDRRSRA